MAAFGCRPRAEASVHPDHHIQFRRALYSVPTQYIGQRVDVRGDSRLVRIYLRSELIKVHPPQPRTVRHKTRKK